jgi:RNA polymerase sigma factor (sigma-70 family)
MRDNPTREELLTEFLPNSDGQHSTATSKIVGAFLRKWQRYNLIDDLFQSAYLAVLTSVDRAIHADNPRAYIATAIRIRLIICTQADETIQSPTAAESRKLPQADGSESRPLCQRFLPTSDGEQPQLNDAIDRPHLNGQLEELCDGLTDKETELIRFLAAGFKPKEIAALLREHRRTINRHICKLRTTLRERVQSD